ncbi:MAG: PilZ domain-containing protein [Nitrospira sp.]|nr:PilZ domain-containing protein [Nitrospira sp.]
MNHRYSERIPVECGAVFSGENMCGEGRVIDVSLPGCLMESPELVKVGDYMRLRLFLPDQVAPLNVPLAVVRRVDGSFIGLEFIRSSDEDQARLTRYVRRSFTVPRKVISRWDHGIELMAATGD